MKLARGCRSHQPLKLQWSLSKEAAQRSHRPLKLQQSLSREAAAGPLNVLRSSFGMLRIIIETEFWELVSSFEAGAELWEPAFQGKLPRGL